MCYSHNDAADDDDAEADAEEADAEEADAEEADDAEADDAEADANVDALPAATAAVETATPAVTVV
jgi:hypothetical protein